MSKREALGEFEQLVLLAIAGLGAGAYGVSIRHEIKARTGRSPTRGAIYITLDRLESKGYLRTWLGDPTPQRGGKAKRACVIEPAGLKAPVEARNVMDQMWQGFNPPSGES